MNLEKILSVAFLVPLEDPADHACPWGLNIMLWGDPGIGKSDRVSTAATMVGLPVRTTYAATSQPEDVSGTAFVNTTKGTAMLEAGLLAVEKNIDHLKESKYLPGFLGELGTGAVKDILRAARRYGPSFSRIEPLLPGLSDLMVDQQGVWFLDELSCARPAVQAAFLGAVLARRVGGMGLPPGVRIVAAANPPESAAGGWELEPPMANRFCHFDVPVPSTSAWGEWLLNDRKESPELIDQGENRVRAAWPEKWPLVQGIFAGFIVTNGAPLHKIPQEGSRDRGRAWPSPRTWAFAARAYATCRCLGVDEDTTTKFIEGCVGEASATALLGWVEKADLPSPYKVLTEGWEPDKKRLDRCIAVYTSMVAHVLSRTDPKEKLKLGALAWLRLQDTVKAGLLDVTLPMAEALVKAGLDSDAGPEIAEAERPVMAVLAKKGMGKFATRK